MFQFRRAETTESTRPSAATEDLRRALVHSLEMIMAMANALDAPIQTKVRLRRMKLAASSARGDIELEAVAMDVQALELPAAGTGVDAAPDVDGIVSDAAEAAEPIARATGIGGMGVGLRRLAAIPQPAPRPPASQELRNELEKLAYGVIFLRQRGDVMRASVGELVEALSPLAANEPESLARLEATRNQLESAEHVGELEQLRELLLAEATTLVTEARDRVERSEEASDVIRFQQSHQKLLEMALVDANAMAETDALTGLANRRGLDRAVEIQSKQNESVGVIAVDLDNFKNVNDTFGHDAGDQVLRHVAFILGQELRGDDRAFRVGGEELLVLLPDTDTAGATRTAERLCKAVRQQLIQTSKGSVQITISCGVSIWTGGVSFRKACKRADTALYAAKNAGRDRVVCS